MAVTVLGKHIALKRRSCLSLVTDVVPKAPGILPEPLTLPLPFGADVLVACDWSHSQDTRQSLHTLYEDWRCLQWKWNDIGNHARPDADYYVRQKTHLPALHELMLSAVE